MDKVAIPDNAMVEVKLGVYRSASGFSACREDGLTPSGCPVAQRWVLRNADGDWVDYNQYRQDLFEQNGLRRHHEAPIRTAGSFGAFGSSAGAPARK